MNVFGKIAKHFIDNRKLSFLIFIAIIVWGMLSFFLMPKQYNPDIVAPAFVIDVALPGATVDEVYQTVTKPLEDVLREIPTIENIYSRSEHGGHTTTTVAFYIGEDIEKSTVALRQKISSRLHLKPIGVSEPMIRAIDPDDLPIKTYVLSSERLRAHELRQKAYELKDALRTVPGTSLVAVVGGRRREFQIMLNPQKMRETKTSFQEIETALRQSSLMQRMGVIKTDEVYVALETHEQVVSCSDIENLIIVSNAEQTLMVKDVARVVEGEEEYESYIDFYHNGMRAAETVFVTISKQKGKSSIRVGKALDERLRAWQHTRENAAVVRVDTVKDEGRVADEEISGLVVNLLQAIGIVFVVLLLFLNVRAAGIVAISIPMTLLTVFGVGYLCGYTINRITLFALILSLGLLVDSATVIIENIVRHKRMAPREAKDCLIVGAVSEIGRGLFLSTVTTVVAFVPMLFVTGMMGPYMGPLPFFVSAALIVSLLFAYTLNPWLAYHFCRDTAVSAVPKQCGIICRLVERGRDGYTRLLTFLLDKKKVRRMFLLACLLAFLCVVSFPLMKLVRFRMLPKADREQAHVYVDLDRGTSVERSHHIADVMAAALIKDRDIVSVQSFVGAAPILDFNGLFKGAEARRESHQITLKLNFTHPSLRKKTSASLMLGYREQLEKVLAPFSDARLQCIEDPPGPPVHSTFLLKVKTGNPQLLTQVAADLEKKVAGIAEVKDVDVSIPEHADVYVVNVNKEEAAQARVNVGLIANEIATVFEGSVIGIYHSDYNYEQEYIALRFDRSLRDSVDDLKDIFVINALGIHVPLSRFVTIEKHDAAETILSDNRERVAYISAEMGQRSVTYACIDLLSTLLRYSFGDHVWKVQSVTPLAVRYLVDGRHELTCELGGEWELTVKVFRDLGLAMACAIVVIYLLLVAQFKSFLVPLLILGTIPLALIGVMPGFALLFVLGRVYFSATSMIGVIALAGIVVNNAIIFIEYVIQQKSEGRELSDALRDAGLTRMRPILLTSITTVCGSLVIAGDPVWSGLAWTIVFGLSLSACLTLIVFPLLVKEFLGDKWFATL